MVNPFSSASLPISQCCTSTTTPPPKQAGRKEGNEES